MANLSKDFHVDAGDWRQSLRSNQRRTRMVIGVFILLYLGLGFLVDLFLNSEKYPQASLGAISHALLTLQLIPYATTDHYRGSADFFMGDLCIFR